MKIRLENFRCFKNQTFDFSKYNILIGENNSGKSSILKLMILLFQSLNKTEHNLTFNYAVDLGTYEDNIYLKNSNLPLIFEFTISNIDYQKFFINYLGLEEKDQQVEKNYNRNSFSKTLINAYKEDLKITFKITKNLKISNELLITIKNAALGVLQIIPKFPDSNSTFIVKDQLCELIYKSKTEKIYINKSDKIGIEKNSFLHFIIGTDLRKYCDKESNPELFHKLAYLLVGQNYIESFFNTLKYINPIQSIPRRYYDLTKIENNFGLDLNFMLQFLNDNDIPKRSRNSYIKKVNEALHFAGLAQEIKIMKNDNIPISQINVKVNNLWSNIMEVGYGIAVQLPIIFGISLLRNQLILIEQPEIHIHPSLQSKLVETIVKYNNNNLIFIETHSEHIIRKLQSLVKEGKYSIKPEMISIHYLKNGIDHSIVTQHKLDDSGKLIPSFPSGFYDSTYKLAKELLF